MTTEFIMSTIVAPDGLQSFIHAIITFIVYDFSSKTNQDMAWLSLHIVSCQTTTI